MKKLLIYIKVIVLITFSVISCRFPEESRPGIPVKPEGIEIQKTSVKDTEIAFKLRPKGESSFYSYMVVLANTIKDVDAEKLYRLGYDAINKGTIKYSENKEIDIVVKNLIPFVEYEVYAVIGSSTGVLSEPVMLKLKTTDIVAPKYNEEIKVEGKTVYLSFDEPINIGKGEITIKVYAINELNKGEQATEQIPVSSFTLADDTKLSFLSNIIVPGAIIALDFPAGALVDDAGNPNEEIASGVANPTGNRIIKVGVTADVPSRSWALPAGSRLQINGTEATMMFGMDVWPLESRQEPSSIYTLKKKAGTVSVKSWSNVKFIEPNYDGAIFTLDTELVNKSESIKVGFPPNMLADKWGNPNAALVLTSKLN